MSGPHHLRQIIDWLAKADGPRSLKDIRKHFPQYTSGSLRTLLWQLNKSGQIVRPKTGFYAVPQNAPAMGELPTPIGSPTPSSTRHFFLYLWSQLILHGPQSVGTLASRLNKDRDERPIYNEVYRWIQDGRLTRHPSVTATVAAPEQTLPESHEPDREYSFAIEPAKVDGDVVVVFPDFDLRFPSTESRMWQDAQEVLLKTLNSRHRKPEPKFFGPMRFRVRLLDMKWVLVGGVQATLTATFSS